MVTTPKNNLSLEFGAHDMPPNLDVLIDGRTRQNLQPWQVFQEHPTLSMIAQVITDYIVMNSSLQKEQIGVLVHQDWNMCAITFDAICANDGRVDPDILATIHDSLVDFDDVIKKHALQDDMDVNLESLCIGGRPDKDGFIKLLSLMSEEQGFHLGPAPHDIRRKIVGAFTLEDIAQSASRELQRMGSMRPTFALLAKAPEQMAAPANEADGQAQTIAENFSEILDAVIGEDTFAYLMTPLKGGFRYIVWSQAGDREAKDQKIQSLFESLEASALPEGVKISADGWAMYVEDIDAFQRLYGHVVEMYAVEPPPPIEQEIEEQELADDLFWNRCEAQTAPDMICNMLYGLGRFRYGIDNNVDWVWELDKDVHHFMPRLVVDDYADHERLIGMMQDLLSDGGTWQDLNISSNPAEIYAGDLRMMCNLLEEYADKRGIEFGIGAIDKVSILNSSEEILAEAHTELAADPTLMSGLGQREYISMELMLTDIAKLLRAKDTGVFISPHNVEDIRWALIKEAAPKKAPATTPPAP